MGCFQNKLNYHRLRSLRADAFRGLGRIAVHSSYFSLLEKTTLRGLQTRGTALPFAPSKNICCSRRTRKTSAAYIARRKLIYIFEESPPCAHPDY